MNADAAGSGGIAAAGSGGVAAGRAAKVRSAEQHRLSVKWSLERLSEGGELRMLDNATFLNSLPATQARSSPDTRQQPTSK